MAVVRTGEDLVHRSCGCDELRIWMDRSADKTTVPQCGYLPVRRASV